VNRLIAYVLAGLLLITSGCKLVVIIDASNAQAAGENVSAEADEVGLARYEVGECIYGRLIAGQDTWRGR